MDFLIGAVVGGMAALITSTLIYLADLDKIYNRYEELLNILRRLNDEYNR